MLLSTENFCVLKWVKVESLSRIRLFATLWTVAYQAPPSMGFSRQEYWSGMTYLIIKHFVASGKNSRWNNDTIPVSQIKCPLKTQYVFLAFCRGKGKRFQTLEETGGILHRNKGTRPKAEWMFQRINSLWWKKATKTLFLQTLPCPLHGSKSAKEKWGFPNSFLFAYRCLFTCHPNIQKRAGSEELERGTSAVVCWLGQSLPRTNLKKDVQFYTQQNTCCFKSTVCFDKYIQQWNEHFSSRVFSVISQTISTPSSRRPPKLFPYPGNQGSCITSAFTSWATREALCSPSLWIKWVFPGVSHEMELHGISPLFYTATFSEHSIFWESSLLLCVLFAEAPADGQRGYLQLSALMNQAAMNIHVQVFVWTCLHFSWLKKSMASTIYI